MVPFAEHWLPVQYRDGVLKEHLHTRALECSSLFDVSHMGQLWWYGKDASDFLESVVVADVKGLKDVSGSVCAHVRK
jgi:aminomethyltransferase